MSGSDDTVGEAYSLQDELSLLDPKRTRLFVNAFEDLILVDEDGVERRVATVLRAFPVASEDRFIILQDDKKRELGTILDLKALDTASRKVVAERLDLYYFTAQITRINEMYEEFHVPKWEVETDRGPRSFEIGSTRRDIRILDGGRILIRDADGNRYEIPDYRKLDPISQGMIETII